MKSIRTVGVTLGGFALGIIGALVFVSVIESAGVIHGAIGEILLLIVYMIGVLNAMLYLSLNNTMRA